jgi:hypothetical protein
VTARLETGETVLWEGRPDLVRFSLNPMLIFSLVFMSLFFGTFAATFTQPTGRGAPPPIFIFFPFIFFAVFFLVPMLVNGIVEGSRTRYVVTDRRILIAGWRRRAEIDLATLQYLELRRSLFGTATVALASQSPFEGLGWGMYGSRWTPALRAIPDADNVYEIISRARARLRSR